LLQNGATFTGEKMMKVTDLDIGDMVYAAHSIIDDGSMPDGIEGEVLAPAGAKGVITLIGHLEEQPEKTVFLVRFEDEELNLGEPIGCWEEDLSVEALVH
jgi:nitrogen fixation protein NifZ